MGVVWVSGECTSFEFTPRDFAEVDHGSQENGSRAFCIVWWMTAEFSVDAPIDRISVGFELSGSSRNTKASYARGLPLPPRVTFPDPFIEWALDSIVLAVG